MSVIQILHNIAKTNNWWWEYPLINMSDVNSKKTETVYEWWKDTKKLTTYSTPEVIDYIKVWGAGMDNEIGILKVEADYLDLWYWISN